MSSIIVRVKQKQIMDLITKGKRLDGRGLTDYREIKVEQGLIERAEGSARVLLGKTEIMAGTKIEIGKPFSDTPNEGVLTVNAELVPLASPTFEPGPPKENAIELARVVDRGIRESKALDFKKLCIKGYTPLHVSKHPIAVTFAKINDKLIVDPWLEEEQIMDARLTVTIDDDGNVCAMQKGGSGYFAPNQVLEAVKMAMEKAEGIRKKLKW